MASEGTKIDAAAGNRPTRFEAWAYGVAGVGFLLEVLTGFGPELLSGEVAGWALLAHLLVAPLFIVGLTLVVIVRAERSRFGRADSAAGSGLHSGQKITFWIGLVLGLVTVSSMLAAMLPVFGYAKQQALIDIHRISALALVILVVVSAFASLATGQAKR